MITTILLTLVDLKCDCIQCDMSLKILASVDCDCTCNVAFEQTRGLKQASDLMI